MSWNRTAGVAGIANVALAFVEFFGPGFPTIGASAATLDSYFADHRQWMLAAVVVQGLGNALWLVFLGGLSARVLRTGALGAGLTTLAGGLLNVAISLAGLAAIAGLAFGVAGDGDPHLVRGLFVYAGMTLVLSNFMLALMAGGVAAAPVEGWLRVLSGAGALVFLAGGCAFAREGAFSPDGSVQFATYGLELVWTLVVSILLLRSPEPGVGADAWVRDRPVRASAER